jgi:hypothetical protein
MGIYSRGLPVTGLVLTIGGAQLTVSWLAAAGTFALLGGLLLLRLARPAKTPK